MIQIGRKIYYIIQTGEVVADTGERQGSVVETTVDQDIESYALSELDRNSFDYIQLEFGMHSEEFTKCTSYKVNLETKQIEFDYTPIEVTEEIEEPVEGI